MYIHFGDKGEIIVFDEVKKMGKRKKINKFGITYYGFDLEKEQKIYFYLCRYSNGRKLKPEEKFDTYSEWKRYISDITSDMSNEKLFEFSKFLSLRMKNNRPSIDLATSLFSVGTTVVATTIVDNLKENFKLKNTGGIFIVTILAVVIAFGVVVALLQYNTSEAYKRDNFYRDYLGAIEELLEQRKNDDLSQVKN